eukprot:8983572-Karenia_brevis.AAC.1
MGSELSRSESEGLDDSDVPGRPPTRENQRTHRVRGPIPESAWASMDTVDIVAEMQLRVPTCETIPSFIRGRATLAFRLVLEELAAAYNVQSELRVSRAWKVFILMWRCLLRRAASDGEQGKQEFEERFSLFERGEWMALLSQAREAHAELRQARSARQLSTEERLDRAVRRVKGKQ